MAGDRSPAPDTVAAGGGQGPGRERSCCGRARLRTPAAALLPRAVSAPRARRAEEQELARTPAAAARAGQEGRRRRRLRPFWEVPLPALPGQDWAGARAPAPSLQGCLLCPSPQPRQSSGARRGTYGVWLGPRELSVELCKQFLALMFPLFVSGLEGADEVSAKGRAVLDDFRVRSRPAAESLFISAPTITLSVFSSQPSHPKGISALALSSRARGGDAPWPDLVMIRERGGPGGGPRSGRWPCGQSREKKCGSRATCWPSRAA